MHVDRALRQALVLVAAADSERAFLGQRPERDESDGAAGLTGMGIFLLVGVPLFVLGTVVLGLD